MVTAACSSGCVGLEAYTSQSSTEPCTVMTLLCSFILLIIKLCLNRSMYNPYTSEHLNGDLRKEYFISDKCPIVCVKCYRSEKCKISSVGTCAIVCDRAHYLLHRRSSVQEDMKYTLVETTDLQYGCPKGQNLVRP